MNRPKPPAKLRLISTVSVRASGVRSRDSVRRPVVAVVVPAFNEALNIENVLKELQALSSENPQWEIRPIVVNDGSTDETERVLDRIAPQYGAHVITLPLNLGIGRTVQTGFMHAVRLGADVTLQIDGDAQHPVHQIPALVTPVLEGRADVVVGSRYVTGAGGNVSSGLRQVGTMFFSLLLCALVGVRIKDVTSGFRAFGFEAVEFLSRYYPDDYPEVQAYVPLVRRGFRILEIPVTMRKRVGGNSSITIIRSAYYMVKVAFATVIDLLRPLPPRRSFGLSSESRAAVPERQSLDRIRSGHGR